jgi:hypothetical protein
MASSQDHNGEIDSLDDTGLPPWASEVATSPSTRPSRASSLISTRTRFSTTTFQDDAKSIDLSISGQHFRISRDGSKVTSVNRGESLPPYPFSPIQDPADEDHLSYSHVSVSPYGEVDLTIPAIEDSVESHDPSPSESNVEMSTAYFDHAQPGPSKTGFALPALPTDTPAHAASSDHGVSSGTGVMSDTTNTLNNMAVKIQRAWRNYMQYRNPSPEAGEPTNSLAGTTKPLQMGSQDESTESTKTIPGQRAPVSPQLGRSNALSVPVPKKVVSFLDKDLPIPDVDHESPGTTSSRSQHSRLTRIGSSRLPSANKVSSKSSFPRADGPWEMTGQLSLRDWYTGENTKPFRDMDSPSETTAVVHPPEDMDSENNVSNHYTRMIRFIDRDHRRALHTRDKEMAELRERLNEKDIVYRQELRARDFLIEDLKKRLEHLEETTETEIERARNQVEDLWESRWKDRDFHLRERMQRMESEMQKTMETTIAEREAFWNTKYEELRRRLEAPEESLGTEEAAISAPEDA